MTHVMFGLFFIVSFEHSSKQSCEKKRCRDHVIVCGPIGKLPCPPNRPFRCKNDKVCLRTEQICNAANDCGDNSDEDECGEFEIFALRFVFFSLYMTQKFLFLQWRWSEGRDLVESPSFRVPTSDVSRPSCSAICLTIAKMGARTSANVNLVSACFCIASKFNHDSLF